ncbi:MAG: hypothetical protein Q8865_04050 [Bacillota bacterium]|nr:hypothetical protein [Bacillota bacterium]
MAQIFAPNKQYSGVSAGVTFKNGIGATSDPYLIGWFKEHGYEAQEPKQEPKKKAKAQEDEQGKDEDSKDQDSKDENSEEDSGSAEEKSE